MDPGSDRRVPAATVKEVRKLATAALTDPDHKQAVTEALGHLGDYSYKMRLKALVEYCGTGLPFLNGSEWARIVVRARNGFAHGLVDDTASDDNPVPPFLAVQESTRSLETLAQSVALCIFVTVLARCCAVPTDDTATAFDRSFEKRALVPALQHLFPELFVAADPTDPGDTHTLSDQNPNRRTVTPEPGTGKDA